jgi:acyl-CoA thioesterase-1
MATLVLLLGGATVAGSPAPCEPKFNTTCAPTATCAKSPYSGTGMACCPLADAVDCDTPLGNCCPKGHTCQKAGSGWEIVVTCKPTAGGGSSVLGTPACKPGAMNRMSKTKKNCLIIGDSVSLGYTPFLTAALAEDCVVQHAPDGGDGGAEETAYGLECLDSFLSNPDGQAVHPELIMFNFGLHDGPCNGVNTTIPGGAGASAVYKPELAQIAAKLKVYTAATKSKLLFASTTPWLCTASTDALVQKLNTEAADVMKAADIPMVDLHSTIVGKCGAAPVAECFGSKSCFCPHCPGGGNAGGYSWVVNSTIVPAIRALLKQ